MDTIKLTGGRPTAALSDMPSVRYRPVGRLRSSHDVVVYRCFDTLRDRPVEVHVAPEVPVGLDRVDIVSRMQAFARADCEGLRPIFEHGFHFGRPFLVMPVLSGKSLADLSADAAAPVFRGELMIEGMEASAIAAAAYQVGIALETLHRAGQAHGGLAVASIRVDHGGRVSLNDFGLLRACAAPAVGPLAMAEDMRELGIVLMSLALGSHLSRPGSEQVVRRELDRLIDRMLSPKPSSRPTADRLVDALERMLQSVPASTAPWTPSTVSLAPRRRRTSSMPAFAAVLAGVDVDGVPDSAVEPSLLGTFINTISVCSARWQVGKSHPEIADLVLLRGWGAPRSAAPVRAVRPFLMALLLASFLGGYWEMQARHSGAEPPEAALATATSMAASMIAPAIESLEIRSDDVDLDEAQPLTASVFALRPGSAPRVVHLRDGVAVGHVARNPYERKTIPARAYPVAALGALRMAQAD